MPNTERQNRQPRKGMGFFHPKLSAQMGPWGGERL